MSKLFKIEGVGLDLTTLDYSPSEDNEFGYLCTSITANNEDAISEYVKQCSGSPLVTKIDFLDRSSEAVGLHLDQIGRGTIDLLLVDAKCDFIKYADELSFLVDRGYVDAIGIYNPESVDRIKEIQTVLPNLEYIGMDICPLNFNHEIISWAYEEAIQIIGFNAFGGHISSQAVIDSFSVPYLLEFFASYVTLGFLSSRDIFAARQDRDYLDSLIGKEVKNPKMYSLDKSVFKLLKPIKKAVEVSLKLDVNHIIPLGFQDTLYVPEELEIRLGKAAEETRDFDVEVGSLEDDIYKYYEDFITPKDTDSDLAILSLFRPHVVETIKYYYSEDKGWEVRSSRAGEKLFIITAIKPHFWGFGMFKRLDGAEMKNYMLYINNKSLEFCELQEKVETSESESEIQPETVESAETKDQDS